MLSPYARAVSKGECSFSISIASLWELTIKMSLGKLVVDGLSIGDIHATLTQRDVQVLAVSIDHLSVLASLPHHHRDPLDRLLIAQAISEGLPILSADGQFRRYPVEVVW